MDALIQKLEKIADQYEPLEEKRKKEDAAKNGRVPKDEFQRIQFEIADQIKEIRQLIKERDEEEASNPGQAKAVRLAHDVRMSLGAVQDNLSKLEAEEAKMEKKANSEIAKMEKKKKNVNPELRKELENAITARKEVVKNVQDHVQECTLLEKKRALGSAAFTATTSTTAGNDPTVTSLPDVDDPRFQKLLENDKQIDELLGIVSKNVATLKDEAIEMNKALKEQGELLEDLDVEVDHANSRLVDATAQVKKLTDKINSKGDTCCIVIFLAVMLVAIVLLCFRLIKKNLA